MHFFLIVFLCKMHRAHHTLRPPLQRANLPPRLKLEAVCLHFTLRSRPWNGAQMFCVDRAMGYFWKQLASIIAVKGGHVEHLETYCVHNCPIVRRT